MQHRHFIIIALVIVIGGFIYSQKRQPAIWAIVVPHHNLVRAQRQDLLAQAAAQVNRKTIYVVSPNHFEGGQGDAITTSRVWTLEQGLYYPEQTVINTLLERGVVVDDDVPFVREHGVFNVLPDLQAVWPEATVVPIMLREHISKAKTGELLEAMYAACANCLVVASVDFSHYQPEELANIHDVATIRDLTALDEHNIWQAEVDSPPSLAVMMGWGRLHNAWSFDLRNRTNSGTIAGNPEVETTTHLFGWYQVGQRQPVAEVTTFMAGPLVNKLDDRSRRGIDIVATDYTTLPIGEDEKVALPLLTDNTVIAGEIRDELVRGVVLPVVNLAGTTQFARGETRQQILNTSLDPVRGIFLIKRTK